MVKIKVKKELKPKGFLKHLLEQEETEVKLDGYTFNYNEEHYSFNPEIIANEVISYNPHSCTFTVEIEEEITEETILSSIVVVRTQYFPNNGKTVNVEKINDVSINKIINIQPNNSSYKVHEIYLMNEVGIGELLWKDGAMVE